MKTPQENNEVKVQSVYKEKRKVKCPYMWQGYVNAKLRELRLG